MPPPLGPIRPIRSPRSTCISAHLHPHIRATRARRIAHHQLVGRQHNLARLDLRAHAELERARNGRPLDAFELVEHLLAATRLFAALASLIAADKILRPRDVLLLRLIIFRPALQPFGPQLDNTCCSCRDRRPRAGDPSRWCAR